jgi:hypothetical protein
VAFTQQTYEAALAEGYTDADIINYLTQQGLGFTSEHIKDARGEGYSDVEIINYLLENFGVPGEKAAGDSRYWAPESDFWDRDIGVPSGSGLGAPLIEAPEDFSNLLRGGGQAFVSMFPSTVKGIGARTKYSGMVRG